MLDGVSLDQLRTFVAAADAGSFSAAGRRLGRAQSVVSQAIATLESQLRVVLFDRTGRYPLLTEAGRLILADARAVIGGIDGLKARAKGIAEGLEPELSVAVDVMFPIELVTRIAAGFGETFPTTSLRLYVEVLGGVAKAVMDGICSLGVLGTLPYDPPGLTCERLIGVRRIVVAAPTHPLAALQAGRNAPLPKSECAKHTQLVLTDRTSLSAGQDFGVLSPRTWRLADLGAKHAFLRAGLGWGGMPLHMVERDLADGTLVRLGLEDEPSEGLTMTMSATYRTDAPPGPSGRWLIDQLRTSTAACPGNTGA